MKKKNLLFALGIVLLSSVILFSGCKKKSEDPAPVPNPTFVMSSTGSPDVIFYFKCTTNDVKLTKCIISDPLGLISDTYDLQSETFLQNQVYYFNTTYTKETGVWTFKFYGNRTGDNSGFISTTTLTLSK
ncbi:MAG: hypothetical protein NTW10_06175 [Bacteroidetes bacterium]|nr:hypothetical protein [Bacteroidota bacterium]